MSESSYRNDQPRSAQPGEPVTIKVNDKRRSSGGDAASDPAGGAAEVDSVPGGDAGERDARDAQIEQLTAELQTARKRVDELARAYQSSESDREAFKQRMMREREQMMVLEKGKVAVSLLEAIDELDMSLANAAGNPMATGVKLIRDGLLKKAEGLGLERVELKGKPFDPNLAEANDLEVTTNPADDGLVVDVLRPAYQVQGRVLRPGRVKVAKFVKPADA